MEIPWIENPTIGQEICITINNKIKLWKFNGFSWDFILFKKCDLGDGDFDLLDFDDSDYHTNEN